MPFLNRSINPSDKPVFSLQTAKQEPLDSDLQEFQNSQDSKPVAEGKWGEEQNLNFVLFVAYYHDIFSCKHKRKSSRIFKLMEEYLKDRTAAQCRSHFQKILLKFKTVAKFRKCYEFQYGKAQFNEQLEKFKTMWEQKHPTNTFKAQPIRQSREFGIQTESEQPKKDENEHCSSCLLPNLQYTNGLVNQVIFNPYHCWNQVSQQPSIHYYYPQLQLNYLL